MKPSDIEREVEITLSSLDIMKKASAPYNFVEKVLVEKSLQKTKEA